MVNSLITLYTDENSNEVKSRINELISKCKHLVGSFSHSVGLVSRLKKTQRACNYSSCIKFTRTLSLASASAANMVGSFELLRTKDFGKNGKGFLEYPTDKCLIQTLFFTEWY